MLIDLINIHLYIIIIIIYYYNIRLYDMKYY